jgi:multidrug efflux pump subunit AcrB
MLSGTPGVIAPAVFGGRLRRVFIYFNEHKLKPHKLSLSDAQWAIEQSNLIALRLLVGNASGFRRSTREGKSEQKFCAAMHL